MVPGNFYRVLFLFNNPAKPGAVDLDLISSRLRSVALKLVFTASLLDAQHYGDSVENKPVSLPVVSLKRHLAGFPILGWQTNYWLLPKKTRYSALIAFL